MVLNGVVVQRVIVFSMLLILLVLQPNLAKAQMTAAQPDVVKWLMGDPRVQSCHDTETDVFAGFLADTPPCTLKTTLLLESSGGGGTNNDGWCGLYPKRSIVFRRDWLFESTGPLPNNCTYGWRPTTRRLEFYKCPDNSRPEYNHSGTALLCNVDPQEHNTGKTKGESDCKAGNPISILTGNKFQVEPDYYGSSSFPLKLTRYYNNNATESRWGENWRSDYDSTVIMASNFVVSTAYIYRPDGKIISFNLTNGQWYPDADVNDRLVQLTDSNGAFIGWRYTQSNDTFEDYDVNGKLITITNPAGLTRNLTYDVPSTLGGDDDPETLDMVTGPFGRTLSFTYDSSKRVETMVDPDGQTYYYAYDIDNNLSTITYPDETPADLNDNPVRTYHYEDNQVNINGNRLYPHALTGITNENGDRFATWAYDAQGRAISSEHANGVEHSALDYTHIDDASDPRVTVTNPLGKNTTYHFTTLFGVRKVTRVEGHATPSCVGANQNYTYDANGNRDTVTDWKGNVTNFDYDARNLEIERIEAQGTAEQRTIQTQWHPIFRVPTQIDIYDNTSTHIKRTTLDYDSAGRLIKRTETDMVSGKNRSTSYAYSNLGLLESIDGPRTDVIDVTTLSYDTTTGNLTQVSNPLGQVSQITAHDTSGRPLSLIDPNGLISQLDYDARGRLKSRTVDGHATDFDYDAVGNLTHVTQPNGLSLTYGYDAARRLIQITDNLNNSIDYTLDAQGNRTQEDIRDPNGILTRTQSRVYDELSRLIQHIGGAGQVTDFGYDTNGNVVSITDGRSNTTSYAFDALNRMIIETDAASSNTTGLPSEDPGQIILPPSPPTNTSLYYDALDQVFEVNDPSFLSTRYTYNALGDRLQIDSPDTGIANFTYDDAGNPISRTDARGITVSYSYDALNRLTSIDYPDNTLDIQLTYDTGINGIGRLSGMADGSGTTAYAYDKRGNLISRATVRDGLTSTVGFDYNSADQLTQITYPSGRVVDYTRDTLGRVASVTTTHNSVTQTLVNNLSYEPFGPLSAMTFGNGIAWTGLFDSDYRLMGQNYGSVLNLSYTHDGNDNLLTISDQLEPLKDQTYTYDVLNRLEVQSSNTDQRDYTYDATGNRLTRTHNTATENYTYTSGTHHLESISGATNQTYQYDANGNIMANNNFSFTYGDHNRLTSVQTSAGVQVADYVYNGHGERVKKTAGSTTYYHYGLNGELIAESDSQNSIQREYIYLSGQPIALITSSNSGTTSPSEIIVDNTDSGFSRIGTWAGSSTVAGYWGAGYRYNAANDAPPGGDVIDNRDAGFTRVGTWATSATQPGYWSTNYRYNAANDAPPSGEVIDNTDAGFSTTGTWSPSSTVAGYWKGGYRYRAVNGGATATWTPSVAAGQYEIYARWTSTSSRISDAQYTVNHASGSTTVTVDQRQNGGQWNLLGTFTVDANSSVVLSDISSGSGYVIADSIKLSPPGAVPNTATWTSTVAPGDYEVFARWSDGGKRVSDAQYTVHHTTGNTIVVKDQTTGGGQWQSLGTFTLDANSYVELSDASNETGYLVADAIKLAPLGSVPNSATWSPNAPAGQYDVYARWTSNSKRVTDAKYTVQHTGGSTTVTVDQEQNGGTWNLLGTFNLDPNSQIILTDQSNETGYLVADAVRLVYSGTPSQTAATYYVHTDHLGTAKILTDQNQTIAWTADAAPFGSTTTSGTVTFNLRFPGQYFDSETGLYYNYFRYYDPQTGRYITSDPIGLTGGLNTYGYSVQNPTNYSDRFGLDSTESFTLIRPQTILDPVITGTPAHDAIRDSTTRLINEAAKACENLRQFTNDLGTLFRWYPELVLDDILYNETTDLDLDDVPELPELDQTGKVHGDLPRLEDLDKYDPYDLDRLKGQLDKSVKERIRKTVEKGRDRKHGQRQGAEQDLIKAIEKHLTRS